MIYTEGSCEVADRPPHVRAASGLSAFHEYLAVIQDDTNWLALIDAKQRITAVPLPRGPGGARIFDKDRGNKGDKYDLEACITIPGAKGHELIGFASGSREGREWILRVREVDAAEDGVQIMDREHDRPLLALAAEFLEARPFYDAMRATPEFSGAGLNIEGALALDDDRILLFQRGNAKAKGELGPVDATAEISWEALRSHLMSPETVPAPPLENITCYDLGTLDGVRLTFSDAEHLGKNRILYSASAEDKETGHIAGSVLGVIDADGSARWTELADEDGGRFVGKIEGLSHDVEDPRKMHFVIDDDDETIPSEMFEVVLSDSFFG